MLQRREVALLSAVVAVFCVVSLIAWMRPSGGIENLQFWALLFVALGAELVARHPEVSPGSASILPLLVLQYDAAVLPVALLLLWLMTNVITRSEKPVMLLQRLVVLALATIALRQVSLLPPSHAPSPAITLGVCAVLTLLDPLVSAVLRVLVSQVPMSLVLGTSLRRIPTTAAFVSIGGLSVMLSEPLGLSGVVVVLCLALVVSYSVRQFSQIQQAYLDTVEALIGVARAETRTYGAFVNTVRRKASVIGARLALTDQETQSLALAAALCSVRLVDGKLDPIELIRETFDVPESIQVHPDSQMWHEVMQIAGAVRGGPASCSRRIGMLAYLASRIGEADQDEQKEAYWEALLGARTRDWAEGVLRLVQVT